MERAHIGDRPRASTNCIEDFIHLRICVHHRVLTWGAGCGWLANSRSHAT